MLRIGCWDIWSAAETRISDGVSYEVTSGMCPNTNFHCLVNLLWCPPFTYIFKTWKQKLIIFRNFVPPYLRNKIKCHNSKYINLQICGISGNFIKLTDPFFPSGCYISHIYVSWFQAQLGHIDDPNSLLRHNSWLSAVNKALLSNPSVKSCLMNFVFIFIIIWRPRSTVLFTTATPL